MASPYTGGIAVERGPLSEAAGREAIDLGPVFLAPTATSTINILPKQRNIIVTPPSATSQTVGLVLPAVAPSIGRQHSVFVHGSPGAGSKITVTASEGSGTYQVADLDTDGDGVVVESDGHTWNELVNVS